MDARFVCGGWGRGWGIDPKSVGMGAYGVEGGEVTASVG